MKICSNITPAERKKYLHTTGTIHIQILGKSSKFSYHLGSTTKTANDFVFPPFVNENHLVCSFQFNFQPQEKCSKQVGKYLGTNLETKTVKIKRPNCNSMLHFYCDSQLHLITQVCDVSCQYILYIYRLRDEESKMFRLWRLFRSDRRCFFSFSSSFHLFLVVAVSFHRND